jgi:hypothetical protein
MRTSVTDRNNALQLLGDRCSGGYVRFYNGMPPSGGPDAALSGNALIVQCPLSNPAFTTPANGSMSSNVIGAGVVAASGAPTFARFFRSDGTTAVVDMLVPEEVTLSKSTWTLGEPFAGPSITWSQALE